MLEGGCNTTLRKLRRRQAIRLIGALVLAKDGEPVWHHTETSALWMRDFSDAFLKDYLDSEGDALLGSVGCYRFEGLGAQLFERVEGDYFSILGLSLLPLLGAALRDHGVLEPMSGQTRLAGVIGWPVAQSLSPRLHGHWLKEHGIAGSYVALPVERDAFSSALRSLQSEGYRGVSVTVPHKEAAFAIAHRVDDAAKAAGAVNQLVFREDGMIEGLNTDAPGLAASLREAGVSLGGKPAILLGAGGAARAAVLALNEVGAGEIRILNRDRRRAEVLVSNLSSSVDVDLVPMSLMDWHKVAGDAALAINTTSAGMKETPSLDLALEALPKTATVCDIVYNPLETGLLKRARALGFKTVDGLGMLMHQAVPACNAFFGVEPKVTPELRRELEKALGHG